MRDVMVHIAEIHTLGAIPQTTRDLALAICHAITLPPPSLGLDDDEQLVLTWVDSRLLDVHVFDPGHGPMVQVYGYDTGTQRSYMKDFERPIDAFAELVMDLEKFFDRGRAFSDALAMPNEPKPVTVFVGVPGPKEIQ